MCLSSTLLVQPFIKFCLSLLCRFSLSVRPCPSLCPCLSDPVCLSVSAPIGPSFHLCRYVCVPVSMSVYRSLCLSVCDYRGGSPSLSGLSACLPVCVSVSLSILCFSTQNFRFFLFPEKKVERMEKKLVIQGSHMVSGTRCHAGSDPVKRWSESRAAACPSVRPEPHISGFRWLI